MGRADRHRIARGGPLIDSGRIKVRIVAGRASDHILGVCGKLSVGKHAGDRHLRFPVIRPKSLDPGQIVMADGTLRYAHVPGHFGLHVGFEKQPRLVATG